MLGWGLTAVVIGCAERSSDAGDPPTIPAGDPPNVLVVLIDDVGVDRFLAWGALGTDPAVYPAVPTLDALAARGVRFDHAYAMPECSPSRATLLTGRYPWRHGVGDALEPQDPGGLSYDERLLPEVIDAPFTVGWVGKWHLSVLTDPIDPYAAPLHHGFDDFVGTWGNLYAKFASDGQPQNYTDWEKDVGGSLERTTRYVTEDEIDEAVARIGAGGRYVEPWFLGVALNAAHDPFAWPPAGTWSEQPKGDRTKVQQFHAILENADHEIGRLLDAMDPAVLDRTVVIVLGDNGSPGDTATGGLTVAHMKSTAYELGVRVPMFVAGPGVAVGETCTALVSIADVFSTVRALAQARVGPKDLVDVDGRSLVPLLADPAGPPVHDTVFAERFGLFSGARMVRDARFKLVRNEDQPDELYDLGAALVEGQDLLADGQPTLSAEASTAYDALTAAMPPEPSR